MRLFPKRIGLSMIALFVVTFSSAAAADPPSRVARLSHLNGAVSFSPAGEEEWVLATPNRPLSTGDRVWVDAGARAELQLGATAVRLGSSTSVTILNLDDRVAQFQLAQGTVSVRARRLERDEFVEVDTPQLAFIQRRAGNFRLDVDPEGQSTAVAVRTGEGEAWGEGASFLIGAGRSYRFFDTGLRDYEADAMPPQDAFDRWAFDRDRREDGAVAARYVAPDVIGYADLDEYGDWSNVESYGNVWIPRSVPSGWAPYHNGHWAWIEPWGWTWVDDAPWGFAPFHYGRWAYARDRWCWVPGPIRARPVYAPALVAFVGGDNFRLSISSGGYSPGIAWFPLGPGEVYRPSYRVSQGYFTNVNVSNTQINNTYVTNVYNNGNVGNVVYQNQRRPGGVTAVPANAFVQSRSVAQAALAVSPDTVARAPATPFASLAPTRTSLVGAGAVASARPPAASQQRPVMARNSPPPAAAPFAQRLPALSRDPGKPLDAVTTAAPAPATKGPSTPIRLVTPSQGSAPVPIPQSSTRVGGSSPGSPQATPRIAVPGSPGQAPVSTVPAPQPSGARPSTPLGAATPPTSAPPAAQPSTTAPSPPQRSPVPTGQPQSAAPSAPGSAPVVTPPGEVRRVPTPPPAASVVPPAGEMRRGPVPPSGVAPSTSTSAPVATPPGETRRVPTPPPAATSAPPAAEVRRGPAPPPSPAVATPAEEVRRPPASSGSAPAPTRTPPEVRPPAPAAVARPPTAPPPAPVPEARREAPTPPAPAGVTRPPAVAPPAPVPEARREPPPPQSAAPAAAARPPGAPTEPPKGGPRREAKPKDEEKKPEAQ